MDYALRHAVFFIVIINVYSHSLLRNALIVWSMHDMCNNSVLPN